MVTSPFWLKRPTHRDLPLVVTSLHLAPVEGPKCGNDTHWGGLSVREVPRARFVQMVPAAGELVLPHHRRPSCRLSTASTPSRGRRLLAVCRQPQSRVTAR